MKKLALLISLVALGAPWLVACEGDDDEAAATAETATRVESRGDAYDVDTPISPITGRKAEPARKSCGGFRIAPPGEYFPIKVEVVEGNLPCRVARRVMKGQYVLSAAEFWSCYGPEGLKECEKNRGRHQGTIRARFYCRDYLEKDRVRCRDTFGVQRALRAKVAVDREAGVGFGLEGRVLTVTLPPYIPSQARNRVSGARIRATCGQGFTGGQGDPRQERTRLWPVGSEQVRFRFRRDISRIARWCRLEDPVVGHVAFVKFRGATLSPEQRIERIGNYWARLFAARNPRNCQYAGQPVCERLACERPGNRPIENCTRPSAEFRNSFRDATVEDVAIKGRTAAAKFSNGEVIELGEDVSGLEHAGVWWWITKVGGNAGRKFFR